MGKPTNYIDETGQRHGKLVVLESCPAPPGNALIGSAWWLCRCDCGRTLRATGSNLRNGHVTSCGCGRRTSVQHVGATFGRLTVLSIVYPRHAAVAICRCACGTQRHRVLASNLVGPARQRSCGCLLRERRGDGARVHGLARHPNFPAWKHLVHRHGDAACAGWRDAVTGPARFIEALGEKPSRRSQLGLLDPRGGYWCGACEECLARGHALNAAWMSATRRARSAPSAPRVEIDGRSVAVHDACGAHGISRQLYAMRRAAGWSAVDAATVRPKTRAAREASARAMVASRAVARALAARSDDAREST